MSSLLPFCCADRGLLFVLRLVLLCFCIRLWLLFSCHFQCSQFLERLMFKNGMS